MIVFNKLYYGFFFSLFDLRVQGFDVLPDFIGYLWIYQGLSILTERNENFAKAKKFAFPLIFISLFSIYQETIPINEIEYLSFSIFAIFIGVLLIFVDLMMVHKICIAIADEAQLIYDNELERAAINRWYLYLVNELIVIMGLIYPSLLGMLFIVMLIVSIVSFILMLGLMNMASKKLDEGSDKSKINT